MRFLAIDVGMGTQDILLYDSGQNIENCIKMVLPSQTQIVAKRIFRATKLKQDIVLTGETMLRFVVDTAGWVDRCSITLVEESSAAWTAAVLAELRGARYRPAWKGGRRVRPMSSESCA